MSEELVLSSDPPPLTLELVGGTTGGTLTQDSLIVDEVVTIDGSTNTGTIDQIETGPRGPIGPPGPAGPPGETVLDPDALGKVFTFVSPADEWAADHNLGFVPNVGLYDPLGREIGGVVTENTEARTVASYYLPVAGRMVLS